MKKRLALDIETFHEYFLIKFKGLDSGITRDYELYDGHLLDTKMVRAILQQHTVITFNGTGYDLPIITLALTGATNAELKKASDWLIVGENGEGHCAWEFYDTWGLPRPAYIDHIDLIEVAFGQGSLKLYGGRLHSKRLQDLPLEPSTIVTESMRADIVRYCENDLDTTIDLYRHLTPQIELRENMSLSYGVDLRSKSDAQIAEAVIRKEVGKLLGTKVERPTIPPGTTFQYKPPEFLKYRTKQLQDKLAEIRKAQFVIADSGSPIEPPALAGATVTIGSGVYRMGIGGLHSSETCAAHWADDETVIMDADVASYYPSIVLNCNLFPQHLTERFLEVYRGIVERRLAAKKAKDTVVADALKITINGSFGKLGSKYSALYAPDLMIQVTVTGQLALLMLIEAFELDGIKVVSANTDGIVLKFNKARLEDVRKHIKNWEAATGFVMEETRYKALLSRDVNNYLAIKEGGGVKGKGVYAGTAISKNPANEICVEAVKALLDKGTPIAQTIIGCRDIRKFLTVRTVRGGAIKITRTKYDDRLTASKKRDVLLADGWYQTVPGPLAKAKFDYIPDGCGYDIETAYRMHCGEDDFDYIGKVVRWYYAQGVTGSLHYKVQNSKGNRNTVQNSEGAKPCMELPEEFPGDVNYEWYLVEANRMLKDIGAV
jgi:hypothetical protein